MNAPSCHACQFELDQSDNFCRRCGIAARDAALPVVRGTSSATVWQPRVSPVVKGAAVMAAGTIGQFVLRRVVTGVLGGGKSKPHALRIARRNDHDGMVDEAQIITETVMMRRVRIRRQS